MNADCLQALECSWIVKLAALRPVALWCYLSLGYSPTVEARGASCAAHRNISGPWLFWHTDVLHTLPHFVSQTLA